MYHDSGDLTGTLPVSYHPELLQFLVAMPQCSAVQPHQDFQHLMNHCSDHLLMFRLYAEPMVGVTVVSLQHGLKT